MIPCPYLRSTQFGRRYERKYFMNFPNFIWKLQMVKTQQLHKNNFLLQQFIFETKNDISIKLKCIRRLVHAEI